MSGVDAWFHRLQRSMPFDIGVEVLSGASTPPSFHAREACRASSTFSSDMRLLRKPGGIEGVGVMTEELDLADLSISDRPELKEVDDDRDAALPPSATLADGSQDPIARRLDELKRLGGQVDPRQPEELAISIERPSSTRGDFLETASSSRKSTCSDTWPPSSRKVTVNALDACQRAWTIVARPLPARPRTWLPGVSSSSLTPIERPLLCLTTLSAGHVLSSAQSGPK